MKILVQWATSTVGEWVQYDINSMADVRAMPRRPVPSDSPLIDDQPGWIAAINIQGVVLMGDHIGFGLNGDGHLVVGKWNDDGADWAGVPFGLVYTFGPLAPDPRFPADAAFALLHPGQVQWVGDRYLLLNTQQTVTKYADDAVLQSLLAGGDDPWAQEWLDDPNRRPWSEFPSFQPNRQLHGVWLEQGLWDQHEQYQRTHIRGWREWGAE